MFKFIFAMIIPVIIFIYTLSFMRWMYRQKHTAAAASAAVLGILAVFISGAALWRMIT
ncbi:hypothetical protein [Alicyclobacillus fodiniaquatilis]|jgi:hypothetical protein|uniref:Uncharacterized protein n=1 Tax=Alicyclobacillus fodiniaquatilis TaxID=1661150 RepID=A0ABW4JQN9_9BACL